MKRLLRIPGIGLVDDPNQAPANTKEELDRRVRAYMISHGLLSADGTALPATAENVSPQATEPAGQMDTAAGSQQSSPSGIDTSTSADQRNADNLALAASQMQAQLLANQTAQNIETQHQRTEMLLAQQALDVQHAAQLAQQAHDALLAQQQHEAQAEALEQQQFMAQQALHNAQDAQN